MKLITALKLRENLISDIFKLRERIHTTNSYPEGSISCAKFNVEEKYDVLLKKIEELSGLRYVINEANLVIQSKLYMVDEYRSLIKFLEKLDTTEGLKIYGGNYVNRVVQFDETKCDALINKYKLVVDALDADITEYRFNTEIPWGDMDEEEFEILDKTIIDSQKENESCGCVKGKCCGHDEESINEE